MIYVKFAGIVEKEEYLDKLLPLERKDGRPAAQLIDAARRWSAEIWAAAKLLSPIQLSAEQVKQGLQLAQNPIFICGVHRSGTTLLRDLLDGHRDLVVLPSEGTYYTNMENKLKSLPENQQAGYLTMEWLRRLANPINQAPYWLLGRSTGTKSPYVEFAQYVVSWWTVLEHKKETQWLHMAIILAYASCTNKLSAKFWIDKTPTNEQFLNRIYQEMPAAKIIQMVREPLATLSSHKKMDPSGGNLRQALRQLKTSFCIASKQLSLDDPNFLLLRYEDLCKTPEKVIAALAGFLQIEPLPILNRPTVAGTPSKANSSFRKEHIAGVILKPTEKKHFKVLGRKEKQLVSAYLTEAAMAHNYRLTKISGLNKFYLLIIYRLFW